MDIKIIGTESLGVRGLSCIVSTSARVVLFDPGVALGYRRNGLLPHPTQVARGERVRKEIIRSIPKATDVISHFHGDHMPLADVNPYQLDLSSVSRCLKGSRIYTEKLDDESIRIRKRVESFWEEVGTRRMKPGTRLSELDFSDGPMGTVMMTRLKENEEVFVHASDIQLLGINAIEKILQWHPTLSLVSGPPLYLGLSSAQRRKAWKCGLKLAMEVETTVIDHHLLRCTKGLSWLRKLNSKTDNEVICAADFMGVQRRMLEANRSELYQENPVPKDWHRDYAKGKQTIKRFQES